MENTTSNSTRESNSTSKSTSISKSTNKFISKFISAASGDEKAYISIWALLMQPYKKYTTLVRQAFHLTMASVDASKIIDHPIQVMMIAGWDATRYLICTLDKTNVQQPLNLHFEKGTFVTFLCNGGGYVHLSGYYKYKVLDDPDSKNIYSVHIKDDLTTKELSDCIENRIIYLDKVYGSWIVQPIQLNAINYQKGEEKKNSKRKVSSPEDEAAKRMKSSANSNENRSNNGSCEDTENSDDDDDDDDDYQSTSSDSDDDSDEIEIQESEEEDSEGQEKNEKQQEKEVTGEEANGKQKKKGKGEQEKNDKTWVLPGGLQVTQLKPGTGKIAEVGKHVTIYYLARVKIGSRMQQIDQCLKGCGLKFKLGQGFVLRGVEKGTVGMKVGEKRRLIIPPKMGYGSKGSGTAVPPHATLVYDVELIKVK